MSSTHSTQDTPLDHAQPDDGVHLWGFLLPCSDEHLLRIDFWRLQNVYQIGRNAEGNNIVLPGGHISNQHCVITWTEDNKVLVQDLSTNGTFINGDRIRHGKVAILNGGDEISFGNPFKHSVPESEDYRYIFHLPTYPVNTLFHQYRMRRKLGSGSYGTVFRVACRSTGVRYAAKLIRQHELPLPSSKAVELKSAEIVREVAIMQRLDHPNICKMKEVLLGGEQVAMILELAKGGTMLNLMQEWARPINEALTQHLIAQVISGVSFVHALHGIAHRDLKPENILLTADNPPIVKIADFGLADIYNDEYRFKNLCGTIPYLAPEIFRTVGDSRVTYDERCDSWSVGVMILNMLIHDQPFPGASQGQTQPLTKENYEQHIESRLRTCLRLDELYPAPPHHTISSSAKDFVKKLLQPSPTDRLSLKDAAGLEPWIADISPYWVFNGELGRMEVNPLCATSVQLLDRVPPAQQSSGRTMAVPTRLQEYLTAQASPAGEAIERDRAMDILPGAEKAQSMMRRMHPYAKQLYKLQAPTW